MIVVKAAHDPEAGVWFTESGDVHGLRIEAATLEALIDRVPLAIQDLLGVEGETQDVLVEVVAHASTRVRLGLAA